MKTKLVTIYLMNTLIFSIFNKIKLIIKIIHELNLFLFGKYSNSDVHSLPFCTGIGINSFLWTLIWVNTVNVCCGIILYQIITPKGKLESRLSLQEWAPIKYTILFYRDIFVISKSSDWFIPCMAWLSWLLGARLQKRWKIRQKQGNLIYFLSDCERFHFIFTVKYCNSYN